MHTISIKRVYELPVESDGYRILVDRLWPRGLKKENAVLDEWNKILPPSTELRKWFDHQPGRFKSFDIKYRRELSQNTEELKRVKAIIKERNLTLLYAAHDPQINHAVILQKVLKETRI